MHCTRKTASGNCAMCGAHGNSSHAQTCHDGPRRPIRLGRARGADTDSRNGAAMRAKIRLDDARIKNL